MIRAIFLPLLALTLLSGCAGGGGGAIGGGRTVVEGAGPEELLKLRAGPGLGFRVVLGLPDGTALYRRDCVTEMGQLWCRVSLAEAPGITGYVSADYLSDE
ncbi:SH3 domain-containing protein [Aquicoccus sp. SCR17]|nr:SH3 domain-containing protein [Carideicomes alvinocaridis]